MNERMLGFARYAGGSLLALIAACAGRYDVGDSPTPTAGASGAMEETGGSGANGGTGGVAAGRGGATSNGGNAAAPGDTGGSMASGGSGNETGGGPAGTGGRGSGGGAVGGSNSGGQGGLLTSPPAPLGCATDAVALAYGDLAAPTTVWTRLEQMWQGSMPETPPELPAETTPEWADGDIRDRLAAARMTGVEPGAFVRFMNAWLETGDDEDAHATAARAAATMVPEGATFEQLVMPPDGTATLFEDPALNRLRSEISTRGSWIQRSVQCINVGPPPLGTEGGLTVPDGMTRRQALVEATSGAACMGCHTYVDPPGYALEGMDPVTGGPRATDNGLPIDTSGTLMSQWEDPFAFVSIRDLAAHLVDSCEVTECFVRRFTTDALQAANLPALTDQEVAFVTHAYVESGRSFEALLRALVRTPTFLQ